MKLTDCFTSQFVLLDKFSQPFGFVLGALGHVGLFQHWRDFCMVVNGGGKKSESS